MAEQTEALARIEPGALAPSPEEEIAYASRIATQLARIIESKKLYKQIGNKKHVYVEGWTAVAALRGMTPREVSNEARDDGSYVASVELVNAEGRVIGAASAECGGPEEPLWQGRPPYARRSMAATRATSKVCRLCFSWILVLEGYSGTPAEEMDGVKERQKASEKPKKAPNRPQTATASSQDWDGEKEVFFGKHKGAPWKDLPSKYVEWVATEMDPPASKMAAAELGRRAALESNVVEGEVVDDKDLPF